MTGFVRKRYDWGLCVRATVWLGLLLNTGIMTQTYNKVGVSTANPNKVSRNVPVGVRFSHPQPTDKHLNFEALYRPKVVGVSTANPNKVSHNVPVGVRCSHPQPTDKHCRFISR